MSGIVLILAIASTAVAVVRGADPASACCMSHKWHGKMMQVGAMKPANGTSQVVDYMFMMDYDYDRKMIRLTGTSRDTMTGMKHNLTVIDDYMHGKIYTVFDGQCMVSAQDGNAMVPPCIPGNFTYEGSYMLGSGANSLLVKVYDGSMMNIASRWALTNDCTPVTLHEYGNSPDGTGIIYSFVFADTVQGELSMANPFAIPMSCTMGKIYTVFDGQCMVSAQDGNAMVPPCIPGNFTYEGSYMLGSGANSLLVKVYDGSMMNIASRWALTNDCTPVTLHEYGNSPDGTGIIYSFVFADTVQGELSTANPFARPMGCTMMPPTVG